MKVSVSLLLEKELQNITSPAAKEFLLMEWYRYMYRFIPFQKGILADNVDIHEHLADYIEITPDGIVFKADGAQYLYFGMLLVSPTTGSSYAKKNEHKVPTGKPLEFSKEQHALACAKWGEVAWNLYSDAIIKSFKEYLLRG